MPVDVDQGHNVTVEFTIENSGIFGTQLVNFTAYAPESDDNEELINASVAVVDDIRNTTQGEAYVDLLETEFETVELVTNDTLLDEMDDYDVFVIYRFVDDTLAGGFLDQLGDDQGVVYLDDMFRTYDERWADGVLRLESVRGDPGDWKDVTFDADQQPPAVNITADHPILDGVGEVGETVILNDGTENLPWGSWFEDYSGEVIAEVDYAASDPEQWGGPGIGVNDAENEVLLPALVHENVLEYLTPEGEALIVNAVAHVAQDVDGHAHTTTIETATDEDFPFFGQQVIHVWEELTLDVGETTTLEMEYEVPEDLESDLYTQEFSTESDAVISDLWVGLEADIEVSSYSLDPDPAEEDLFVGETLTAEAVLANDGEKTGEFEVEYIVDEEVVSNETVEVDANTSKIVELDHQLRESGTKIVSVNGVDPVQIDVAPEPDTPHFDVTELDGPESVAQGTNATISAVINNTGASPDTQTITFQRGNDTVESQNVTLSDGDSEPVEFVLGTDELEPDTYEYSVASADDVETGSLTTTHSVVTYTDENGTVQTDGLLDAIDDWRGEDVDTGLLLDVIDVWRSGTEE